MMRKMISHATAALGSLFALQAAQAADTVVIQWNDVALQAIRDTRPWPPVTARALAVIDTCMYDAWTAFDPWAVPTRDTRHCQASAAGVERSE